MNNNQNNDRINETLSPRVVVMNPWHDGNQFGSALIQMGSEAAREAGDLHLQQKGELLRPDAHQVVALLAVVPQSFVIWLRDIRITADIDRQTPPSPI
jgi:hypothetical protein